MKCYRKGRGCGPYEGLPCGECPASKPDYGIENESSKTPPRIVYLLDLEVDEIFEWRKKFYHFNSNGDLVDEKGIYCDIPCQMIQHPELITRSSALQPSEIELCKKAGAKYVTRDTDSHYVELWAEKPEWNGCSNYWYGKDCVEVPLASFDRDRGSLFKFVQGGACIFIDE